MENEMIFRFALEAVKSMPSFTYADFFEELVRDCDSPLKASELYEYCTKYASEGFPNFLPLATAIRTFVKETENQENMNAFLKEQEEYANKTIDDLVETAVKAFEKKELIRSNKSVSFQEETAKVFVSGSYVNITESDLAEQIRQELPAFYNRVAGIFFESEEFHLREVRYAGEGLVSFLVDDDAAAAAQLYARKAIKSFNQD